MTPTVMIETRHSPVMVAPSQVWLRAVNHAGLAPFEETGSVYDGAHHEYYHEWTINGQPLPDWAKPTNLIPAYNNPNKAFGREVAFLLPTAGSYVIDLVVTDRDGNKAMASTSTLMVVEPERYFPASQRIYVDPDGDFTGVPVGAKTATTIDGLRAHMATFTWNVNPPWVLFRGGKTHDFGTRAPGVPADSGWLKLEQEYPAQYLSSFGSGRAKIIPSTEGNRNTGRALFEVWGRPVENMLTFTGIDFEGYYDAATERGGRTANGAIGFAAAAQLQNAFVLCHDLIFDGFDKGLYIGAGAGVTVNNRMMVADCVFTNWRDYGTLGGHGSYRYAYVGNRIAQHVDALHGGDKSDALVNAHNPLRIQKASYAYIAQNDFFSRTGWSTGGKNNRADQPCLRLLVSPEAGQAAHVERNAMEGGFQNINLEDAIQDDSVPSVPFNVVIESNLLVGTAKNMGMGVGIWRSGVTIRNNVFLMPDVPQPPGHLAGLSLIRMEESVAASSADNTSNPIAIYNNTYLNLMSEQNADSKTWPFILNDNNYFTNVTEENNLIHKPYMTNSATASAPIDTSTPVAGFTPRFKGERYGYDISEVTLMVDVPVGRAFTVPYSLLLKVLNNSRTVDDGGATDQAYWVAIANIDTRHSIWLRDQETGLNAEHGHFSISFDASGVVITNTSGFTWTGGQKVVVHLDRTSLIPPMNTAYASPTTIPLPRPLPGSPAYRSATMGRVAPKDALLVDRAESPSRGALEPTV